MLDGEVEDLRGKVRLLQQKYAALEALHTENYERLEAGHKQEVTDLSHRIAVLTARLSQVKHIESSERVGSTRREADLEKKLIVAEKRASDAERRAREAERLAKEWEGAASLAERRAHKSEGSTAASEGVLAPATEDVQGAGVPGDEEVWPPRLRERLLEAQQALGKADERARAAEARPLRRELEQAQARAGEAEAERRTFARRAEEAEEETARAMEEMERLRKQEGASVDVAVEQATHALKSRTEEAEEEAARAVEEMERLRKQVEEEGASVDVAVEQATRALKSRTEEAEEEAARAVEEMERLRKQVEEGASVLQSRAKAAEEEAARAVDEVDRLRKHVEEEGARQESSLHAERRAHEQQQQRLVEELDRAQKQARQEQQQASDKLQALANELSSAKNAIASAEYETARAAKEAECRQRQVEDTRRSPTPCGGSEDEAARLQRTEDRVRDLRRQLKGAECRALEAEEKLRRRAELSVPRARLVASPTAQSSALQRSIRELEASRETLLHELGQTRGDNARLNNDTNRTLLLALRTLVDILERDGKAGDALLHSLSSLQDMGQPGWPRSAEALMERCIAALRR